MSLKKIIVVVGMVATSSCSMKNGEEVVAVSSANDRTFMTAAGYGNIHLKKAGLVTAQKSGNQLVKSFAHSASGQFTKAQEDLQDRAAYFDYPLPSVEDSMHRELIKKLESSQGREHDSIYLLTQIIDLKNMQGLYENRLAENSHGLLGKYAENWLPQVRKNIEEAESIKTEIKLYD